ncbi:type III pantothenate kinase [Adlercreutzia rubneri]|uniref:type III pantothenate kinase n=1 Tax=Adlercreutzia rubneri TaxID=2916441 RepID=UPI003529786C
MGVYAGDSLRAMWRIATNRKAAADELSIVFSTLFSLEGLDLSQVRASAVASVVPQLRRSWARCSPCALRPTWPASSPT